MTMPGTSSAIALLRAGLPRIRIERFLIEEFGLDAGAARLAVYQAAAELSEN